MTNPGSDLEFIHFEVIQDLPPDSHQDDRMQGLAPDFDSLVFMPLMDH